MTRLESFMAARAAESYAEPLSSQHTGITAQMAAIVAPMLPPGGSLLDVGCGQGPALEWFSKSGFDVTGITVNADDLRACKAAGFHEVYPCDMHDVVEQFGADEFDCVWARHVVEHSPIPLFALAEFRHVLKPGGILYFEVPLPDTPCNHVANLNHNAVFGKDAWLCLIDRAGFEILEVREIALETMAGPDKYLSIIAKKI